MATIGIYVGTVYGNALLVAEQAEPLLAAAGHQVQIFEEPELSQWLDESINVRLIITSTTGQGEVPESIAGLFFAMKEQLGYQPSIRYGVIALGDSSYENYCAAGLSFDELLQEHQARRIGDVLLIDAGEHPEPEEVALPWIQQWASLL